MNFTPDQILIVIYAVFSLVCIAAVVCLFCAKRYIYDPQRRAAEAHQREQWAQNKFQREVNDRLQEVTQR